MFLFLVKKKYLWKMISRLISLFDVHEINPVKRNKLFPCLQMFFFFYFALQFAILAPCITKQTFLFLVK